MEGRTVLVRWKRREREREESQAEETASGVRSSIKGVEEGEALVIAGVLREREGERRECGLVVEAGWGGGSERLWRSSVLTKGRVSREKDSASSSA